MHPNIAGLKQKRNWPLAAYYTLLRFEKNVSLSKWCFKNTNLYLVDTPKAFNSGKDSFEITFLIFIYFMDTISQNLTYWKIVTDNPQSKTYDLFSLYWTDQTSAKSFKPKLL